MKQFGLLLILLVMFMAACSSGGAETAEQVESEETLPPVVTESAQEIETTEPAPTNVGDEPVDAQDDSTAVRERDWKQGNTTDPAVTIIEYGDFQ